MLEFLAGVLELIIVGVVGSPSVQLEGITEGIHGAYK